MWSFIGYSMSESLESWKIPIIFDVVIFDQLFLIFTVQFFVIDKFISNHTWWWRRWYGCYLCSGYCRRFCLQLCGRGCYLCRFCLSKWNTFVRSVAFALFFFVCWLAFFEIYFANDILFLFRMNRFGWIAETKNTHLELNDWIKMRCCKICHFDI